jgi:valyl-tRNA synthetase
MNLPKAYQPNAYEPTIYALWETSGAFKPSGQGEPYSIVMPPPNANGNLHVGHSLMAELEDILVRFYRMKGRDTLYIPGADHAGFETWVVYERELQKNNQSRFDN